MKMNSLTKHCVITCVTLLAAQFMTVSAFAADSETDNRGQLSSSDYKFAKEAATGGMFEVQAGNVAASNSGNSAVQQFGQRMVNDHGKAGQQLAQIAAQKGATLPTTITTKQQKELDKLSKLKGTHFDKDYMAEMVKAHKADEKLFKRASEDIKDPDLKAWATTTLSMVQNHLKMAEDLDATVKHELSMNNLNN